ncbi:hypothetical protein N7462_003165 [Penicillium macrosclerotiorum]|uniref:uncharacterized protein n=1 Tax=Penicillium macrosclerotiorum TaxID=303699 RepID=UPI002547173F|nr:uncharacterized protein N7462_003165 [Penicillium macrosclerotiorum]KAJ5688773.1 hypothetical protein N7462_003165 [Penicillium macrosclerotiorum]
MKAWLYSRTTGGLETNLHLSAKARVPPVPRNAEVLVRVISAAINPADYKVPELGLPARLVIGMPSSPGMDFCGRVVATGPAARQFTPGTLVFGSVARPVRFGSLAEYMVMDAGAGQVVPLPDGVAVDEAAGVGIAGVTAMQSLAGYVTAGSRVLVNGGSGGCGVFAIQIAKQMGCIVTATCSTRNRELCLRLGADEILDYTAEKDLVGTLASRGLIFDHIVDHIGTPGDMYYRCHEFLKEGGVFVQVGASSMTTQVGRMGWPALLGGGRRKYVILLFHNDEQQLRQLGEWMAEGALQVPLDSVHEFEDAVQAFKKLRSGRARGKIIVHVTKAEEQNLEPFGIGL